MTFLGHDNLKIHLIQFTDKNIVSFQINCLGLGLPLTETSLLASVSAVAFASTSAKMPQLHLCLDYWL